MIEIFVLLSFLIFVLSFFQVGLVNMFMSVFLPFILFYLVFYVRQFFDIKKIYTLIKSDAFLVLVVSPVLGLTLFINLFTPVMGWDSLSLYDFRSKVFQNGGTEDLYNYTVLDSFNPYYLFSYPFYTSYFHFVLSKFNINASLLYSFFWLGIVLLTYRVFLAATNSRKIAALTALFISTTPTVFSQATIAYSNLPYAFFLIYSFYLCKRFIEEKSIWLLIGASSAISVAVWVRHLEPFYIPFVLISIFYSFLFYKKKIHLLIVGILVSLAPFILVRGWIRYVENLFNADIGVTPNIDVLPQAFFGLVNSWMIKVLIKFISSLEILMIFYVVVLVLTIVYVRRKIIELRFVNVYWLFVASIMLLLVFGGMYYSSFKFIWWDQIPGSLLRSSLPIYLALFFQISSFYQLKLRRTGAS